MVVTIRPMVAITLRQEGVEDGFIQVKERV